MLYRIINAPVRLVAYGAGNRAALEQCDLGVVASAGLVGEDGCGSGQA